MKKNFSFILILMLILGFCVNVFASSQSYEAEGIFVMGDNDTKAQAKDYALQDAKRIALEQSGTYLRSTTQVVNGQVTKDDITSIASGIIKLDKIVTEETKFNNGVISLVVKARFIIDSDDLQKKIEILQQSDKRQEEIQKLADLQKRYDILLAENNHLKTQLAQTNDKDIKEQLLIKTQEIDKQLTATQWLEKGNTYAYAKNYDGAIEAFSKSIALDPQFPFAYYNRGTIYNDKGQYDLAIADFNKTIALNPQYESSYTNRGFSYAKKGQSDLAIADYSKAIALNPQDITAYNNRGTSYKAKKQYDLAIADYNKVIQSNPQHVTAYVNRGVAHSENGQRYLAIADFNKAISIDPQNANAYYNRGFWYLNENRYDLALADYNKVLELNPQDEEARNWRDIALELNAQYPSKK